MIILRVLTFALVVVAFLPGIPLRAGEPSARGSVSKHISDAILAGFRQGEAAIPAPATIVTTTAAPSDVDPVVVVLPKFTVVGKSAAKLDRDVFTPTTEAIPLTLGTGITEFKGKKFTVLVRKIFFIPIGFKIEW